MKYLLSIFLLILCSCSSEKEKTPTFYFDEKKFKSEWDMWKSQDIKNYSFKLKGKLDADFFPRPKAKSKDELIGTIPMYPYEAKITVKNGIMDSYEYIGITYPGTEIILTPNVEPEFISISDMYQKIYDDIKDWESILQTKFKNCLVSWGYEVEYDQKYHYIKRSKPTGKISEDCLFETTKHEVTASDFTILND